MLLGLYYTTNNKDDVTKELVEANIGTNYIDYKDVKGYTRSLIFNSELPNKVLGGAREIGIDNKGNRADSIIDYMAEVFRLYHKNINIKIIFDQLLTFVQDYSKSGKEVWGALAKQGVYNDVLYACVYAYIARLCYPHRHPVRETQTVTEFVVKHELVRDKDNNLVRTAVRRPGTRREVFK
jgi:hypothetical protein